MGMLIISSANILDTTQSTITETEGYACMDDDNLADIKLQKQSMP